MRHRPIGIGVQGLADVFMRLRVSWDSEQAKRLNREIFETIYHAAVEASMEEAMKEGHYQTFPAAPPPKVARNSISGTKSANAKARKASRQRSPVLR